RPGLQRELAVGRARSRDGDAALARTVPAKPEDTGAKVRRVRHEGKPRGDDEDLGRERRERPASGERDVEADEDEKDRPEARDSEPGHSGDEAHGLEQKEQTEGDQKERPENASTAA